MKQHFGEAYENLTNTQELSDKYDDSINTITDVMSNVVGTMKMASNANAQSMNAGMTAMRQEMVILRAEVQARRQVLAHNTMWTLPPAAPPAQWTPYSTLGIRCALYGQMRNNQLGLG